VPEAPTNTVRIDGQSLTLEDVVAVADGQSAVELSPEAFGRMGAAFDAAKHAAAGPDAVYGINTGFGPLKDKRIEPPETEQLQLNLVRSHAAGVGPPFASRQVRAAMLVSANCLAKGCSGIDPRIVQLLVQCLNKSFHPLVPSQGSLGASGDLAPLAHVALALIGEGEVEWRGKARASREAMKELGLEPAKLGPKCGLALINGTSFITGVGGLALDTGSRLAQVADVAAAMHVEASLSSVRAFDEGLMALRPHPGQAEAAANLRRLTEGSGLVEAHKDCGEVQDAYSVRCAPQVHGATRHALRQAREVVTTEINSATDNPLLVDGRFMSSGNFHGAPCALALDHASLGLIELCNISERRTERLLNPTLSRGLPAFLAGQPGLESGLMLAHYTAAALTSENKSAAFPPSADTIPTGANQEDHVSMGLTSARRLTSICENALHVLSIEVLCAARALRLRMTELDRSPAKGTHAALQAAEGVVPPQSGDRPPAPQIAAVAAMIREGGLLREVETVIGALE
jgi:histidine ammonia-lyase